MLLSDRKYDHRFFYFYKFLTGFTSTGSHSCKVSVETILESFSRKTASSERDVPSGTQAKFPSVPEAGFSPDTRGSTQVAIRERIKVTVTFLHTIAKSNIGHCQSPTAPSLMYCT